VSAIEDLSWKKWSSAYAVCRLFFKDQKWPKSSWVKRSKEIPKVLKVLRKAG
jgi:hypothetical protein